MIKRSVSILILGVAAAAAPPATAAVWPAAAHVDPYAADALVAGRTAAAEAKLASAYARGDRSPEVLLNLAAARLRGADAAGARDLYRAVLAQPDADLLTATGSDWSHAIARTGLALSAR